MNWILLILGLLSLALGVQSSLRDLGAPGWMIDFLARLPVFGLSPWIFVLVGIVLIYFGFKVGSQWR